MSYWTLARPLVAAAAAGTMLLAVPTAHAYTSTTHTPPPVLLEGDFAPAPSPVMPRSAPLDVQAAANASLAFEFDPQWMFTGAVTPQHDLVVSGLVPAADIAVELVDASGTPLWSLPLDAGTRPGNVTVPYEVLAALPAGTYQARLMKGESVLDVTVVRVVTAWVPLLNLLQGWTLEVVGFKACSTLRYFYDRSTEPAGVIGDPEAEFVAAVNEAALEAGLAVVPARSRAESNLVAEWDNIDAAGRGGWRYDSGQRIGFVVLDTDSTWALGQLEHVLPRTGLVRHEVLHAFGLGHVNERTSLMAPLARPGISPPTWGEGEKQGLRSIYTPEVCGTSPAPPTTPDDDPVPGVDTRDLPTLTAYPRPGANLRVMGPATGWAAGEKFAVKYRGDRGGPWKKATVKVTGGLVGFNVHKAVAKQTRAFVLVRMQSLTDRAVKSVQKARVDF